MCFGGLPHSLIMSPSVQFGFSLGMRLHGRRFGYLQRVVCTKNFWNFKAIPKKSFWCLFKTNLFWKIQAILMDRFAWVLKNFGLLLVKWSDVSLVKRVQTLIWGFQRTSFRSSHLLAWIMTCFHGKAKPTNPDCLHLIRKGLIEHVT